jgi:hypothetical protein
MIVRSALLLFSILCLQQFVSAQQASEKTLLQLKPGMSDVQVRQIIGDPTRLENFSTVAYNTSDTTVYWRYGTELVLVITNHMFNRTELNREQLLRYIQQHAFQPNAQGLIIVNHGKK